jgi:hypothetical protein
MNRTDKIENLMELTFIVAVSTVAIAGVLGLLAFCYLVFRVLA